MTDTRIAEYVKALAPPARTRLWHGGASPLGCVRGVRAEEAAWKPSPDRHSIWDLVLHMAYWKYAVRRRLIEAPKGRFPRKPSNWPEPSGHDQKTWEADRVLLRKEHEELVQVIRSFEPERLDQRVGEAREYTYSDLMMGIVMHDTYHTGQIQLMKRLYSAIRD